MAGPLVGVGEILWDIFPDGRKVAGGAPFNFAFHCHQLGHQGIIVSVVGDDDLGQELREEVLTLGLSDRYIVTDPTTPTGQVQVTLTDGQPSYTIKSLGGWDFITYSPELAELARRAKAVCHGSLAMSQSRQARDLIAKFAMRAQGQGAIRIFDANIRNELPLDVNSVFEADWLKGDTRECDVFLSVIADNIDDGIPIHTFPEMLDYHWQDQKRPLRVLITHGRDGCEVYERGIHRVQKSPFVQVVDTVGAGDAFTAAMICMHLEGQPLETSLRFACHYAARVCEHQGATPRIDRSEVELTAFGRTL